MFFIYVTTPVLGFFSSQHQLAESTHATRRVGHLYVTQIATRLAESTFLIYTKNPELALLNSGCYNSPPLKLGFVLEACSNTSHMILPRVCLMFSIKIFDTCLAHMFFPHIHHHLPPPQFQHASPLHSNPFGCVIFTNL